MSARTGVSVGRLANMRPKQLAKTCRDLRPEVRLRLVHLANLGIARSLRSLNDYQRVIDALSADEPEGTRA